MLIAEINDVNISLCPTLFSTYEWYKNWALDTYIDLLKKHHIEISMAAVGKAEENGFAERVIRTIKEEEVYLSDYVDFADAAQQVGHFIEDTYMTKRIHSSLGYLTPVGFETVYEVPLKLVMAGPP